MNVGPRGMLPAILLFAGGAAAVAWLGPALRGDPAAIRYGLIAAALIAVLAFVPRLARRPHSRPSDDWIEAEELAARLGDGNIAVIDVRGPDEFVGPLGHIAGARNLPLAELAGRPDALAALRDQPVVLVCRTDKRSATAAQTLRGHGFRQVRVLRGGMERWNQTRPAGSLTGSKGGNP